MKLPEVVFNVFVSEEGVEVDVLHMPEPIEEQEEWVWSTLPIDFWTCPTLGEAVDGIKTWLESAALSKKRPRNGADVVTAGSLTGSTP